MKREGKKMAVKSLIVGTCAKWSCEGHSDVTHEIFCIYSKHHPQSLVVCFNFLRLEATVFWWWPLGLHEVGVLIVYCYECYSIVLNGKIYSVAMEFLKTEGENGLSQRLNQQTFHHLKTVVISFSKQSFTKSEGMLFDAVWYCNLYQTHFAFYFNSELWA